MTGLRRAYPGRGERTISLRRPALLGLAAAALVWGCGSGGPAPAEGGTNPPAPEWAPRGYTIQRLPAESLALRGAAASLDDLLRTVERGLAERDTARLEALTVNAREFRSILFPAFPAAHPPIDAPVDVVWIQQFTDTRRGLRHALHALGGRDVRIEDIRFDRPNQDFVNFVLDETSHVDLVVDGERLEDVRLFGSVVRVGDRWKVLTWPDDAGW